MKRVMINLLAALGLAVGVGAAAYLDEKDRRQRWRLDQGSRKYQPKGNFAPRGRSIDSIRAREAWRDRKDNHGT